MATSVEVAPRRRATLEEGVGAIGEGEVDKYVVATVGESARPGVGVSEC